MSRKIRSDKRGKQGSMLQKLQTAPLPDDFVPPTFKLFAPRNTVPAACVFLRATGHYSIIVTPVPKTPFPDRLELVRDPPTYKLCIFPSNDSALGTSQSYINLTDLKSFNAERRRFVMDLSFKKFDLEVRFKHEVHFQYFSKMFEEVVKINSNTIEDYECPKQVQTNYKYVEEQNKVVALSIQVVVSRRRQFHVLNCVEWKPPEWNDWMKHVRVQYRGEAKIMSLFEVLCQNGRKNYTIFINYVSKDFTYSNLLSEITRFEREEQGINPGILPILRDEELRVVLKRECQIIKENHGNFNTPYFLVLEKRIKFLKNILDNQEVRLRDVQEQLLSTQRFRWSVPDCRSHILSMLLYRKSFESWVKDKTVEFEIFEKRNLESSLSVEWYDDDRPVLLDPEKWTKVLEEFNERESIKIELLSFKVMIKKRQNDLRIKRRDTKVQLIEGDGELVEVQKQITSIDAQLTLKQNRVKNYMSKLEMFQKKTPPNTRGIQMIQKRIDTENKTINEKLDEKAKLEETVSQGVGKDRQVQIDNLEEQIKDCIYGLKVDELLGFLKDSGRRAYIERLLKEKLVETSKKGMSEFGVQLVISILGGHKVPKWQKEVLKKIDRFISPTFYRWGFIHANCQVANLGCHLFSDSLVMLTDLAVGRQYEEIIAIECHCALMVDHRTAYTRLTKLAEEIVDVNVNYQYQTYSIINRNWCLNCQEFAKKLIDNLNATKFFPEVTQYLDDLRGILERTKEQSSSNLRYLSVTDTFKKTFAEVFRMKEFKLEGKQKNKLYFRMHQTLDHFFKCCQDCDDDFELNYPGIYQLLKGFDRAFWIGKSKRKKDPKLLPHNSGCPFSQHGEVLEGGEEEEEEMEGER